MVPVIMHPKNGNDNDEDDNHDTQQNPADTSVGTTVIIKILGVASIVGITGTPGIIKIAGITVTTINIACLQIRIVNQFIQCIHIIRSLHVNCELTQIGDHDH